MPWKVPDVPQARWLQFDRLLQLHFGPGRILQPRQHHAQVEARLGIVGGQTRSPARNALSPWHSRRPSARAPHSDTTTHHHADTPPAASAPAAAPAASGSSPPTHADTASPPPDHADAPDRNVQQADKRRRDGYCCASRTTSALVSFAEAGLAFTARTKCLRCLVGHSRFAIRGGQVQRQLLIARRGVQQIDRSGIIPASDKPFRHPVDRRPENADRSSAPPDKNPPQGGLPCC